MARNLFRVHTALLKNTIAGELSGDQLKTDLYVKCSIPASWRTFGKDPKVPKITEGDYEERLREIIEAPMKAAERPNLIILRGGTGSGKSTTVRFALQFVTCHKCTDKKVCDRREPLSMHIDLFEAGKEAFLAPSEPSADVPEQEGPGEASGDLKEWSIFQSKLEEVLSRHGDLDEDSEVTEFWPWLKANDRFVHNPELKKLLTAQKHNLKKPQVNASELKSARKDFIKSASLRDLCYYDMLMLKYIRRDYKGLCNLIVIDNVDSLRPFQQRDIMNYAVDVFDLLRCRVIVVMRPYTVSISANAAALYETIDHWSPEPLEVLKRRINLLKDESEPEKKLLFEYSKRLLQTMVDDKFMSRVFSATCELGVRYALRNFYNLTLSPLLNGDETGKTNIGELDTNVFYQAYFCHETEGQLFHEENFNNIFSVTLPDKPKRMSNIKLRILHSLYSCRPGNLLLRDMTLDLQDFGYGKAEIAAAFTDMLRNKTPLIWSDNCLSYTENQVDLPHGIVIAPLGTSYYEDVIRDPLYVRECIFGYDGQRKYGIEESVPRCIEALKQLADEDRDEILRYLSKRSRFYYLGTYQSIKSIGNFLWDSLGPSFKNLSKGTTVEIDELYGEYHWRRVRDNIYYEEVR